MSFANTTWLSLCQNFTNSVRSLPETKVICFLNGVFSVVAIIGNLIILVTIYRTSSLHSPSNTILFSLALTDFGVGLLVQPLLVTFHVLMFANLSEACHFFTAYNVASSFLAGISLSTVTAMSLDRYLCLHLHLRYHEVVTSEGVRRVLFIVWLVCALLTCTWLESFLTYSLTASVVVVICLCLITFSYVNIFRIVLHHRAQIHDRNPTEGDTTSASLFAQYAKTTMNTFVVVVVLSVCFMPYLVVLIIMHASGPSIKLWLALDFAASTVLMNSSLNPFLYCLINRDIRTAVKRFLKLLFFHRSQNDALPN